MTDAVGVEAGWGKYEAWWVKVVVGLGQGSSGKIMNDGGRRMWWVPAREPSGEIMNDIG